MMMRMIHGTLPTCEKINRLVEVEKLSNNNGYYQTKYQKHTNEGLCPCCGQAEETVKHLFFECENNQIEEIREQLKSQVKKAVKHYLPDSKISTKFIGTQYNNNPEWDNYLASLGLIPNTTVKEIQELLEDEQKHKLKTIIADIAKNIMDTNIDIWKHRCKILYGNWQAIT